MAFEWVAMGYLLLTLFLILFMYTSMKNPQAMLLGRLRIIALTAAMWIVYRMAQSLFGCQPALLFSKVLPGHVFSELFDMGYAAYYPMIAATAVYYFGWKYREFNRAAFIILASFFIYYVVFIFVPVAGPTFYYKAVGLQNITAGVFPNLHGYFNHHQACLPSPGFTDGIFYHLVEDAKAAGERPTAAFPSSHVGVSTICMLLLWHDRNYRLLAVLAPFYLLLCCATVYIQAHYLVDAIAGFLTACILFAILLRVSRPMMNKE